MQKIKEKLAKLNHRLSFHARKRFIDKPVFIFAACWRSGSTLLQRIVNASGEALIWGEPGFLEEATVLCKRVDSWFDKVDWNREAMNLDEVGQWIPVASPSKSYVTNAFQSFFFELYGAETREFERKRWGMKEVRDNFGTNMLFLRKIFPTAKFIFLVRDPYDTYRSVKGTDFFPVFKDAFDPVRIWTNNVGNFLSSEEIKQNCLLVKYEDLCNVSDTNKKLLEKISRHLELPLTEKMFAELMTKTASSSVNVQLENFEKEKIADILGDTPSSLGYK